MVLETQKSATCTFNKLMKKENILGDKKIS